MMTGTFWRSALRRSLLLCALLALVPLRALAFESWEHQPLGDLAFHLAKRIYCESNRDSTPVEARQQLCAMLVKAFYNPLADTPANWRAGDTSLWKQKGNEVPRTYGSIDRCVDYYLTPEKLLAAAPRQSTVADLERNAGSFVPRDWSDLHPAMLQHCGWDSPTFNLPYAQASHTNHTHFQREMMIALLHYHALAISTAREERPGERNVFGALMLNAISDHYLHDYFAPGHIKTFRSHLSDVIANAAHDQTNRIGLTFVLDREGYVAQRIDRMDKLRALSKLLGPLVPSALERQYFFAMEDKDAVPAGLQERHTLCESRCSSLPAEHGHADLASDWVNYFRRMVLDAKSDPDAAKDSLAPAGTLAIKLKGDTWLWHKTTTVQRVIMLVDEINSILDVLCALGSAEGADARHNAFAGVYFGGADEQPGGQVFASIAGKGMREGYVKPHGMINQGRPTVPNDDGAPPFPYVSHDRIVTGSYSYEPFVRGVGAGRSVVSIGITEESHVLRLGNFVTNYYFDFGLALSREGTTDGGRPYTTAAVYFRPVFTFPESELAVSLPMRVLKHAMNAPFPQKPTVGLRFDQGFSSFMTFYLQANFIDYAVNQAGKLERHASIGAGVQFVSGFCRVPWLSQVCRW